MAVIEVTDRGVVLGDPLEGKIVMTHDQFKDKWRLLGVVLRREP